MNKSISILLTFIIFFAPFAFGAVDVWAEFVLKISILTIFFLFLLMSIKTGVLEYRVNALNIFFTAFILYTTFQIVFKVSILPHYTFNALETGIVYFGLYFVVTNMFGGSGGIYNVISRITVAGFFVSSLGIVQAVTKTDKIYWVKHVPHSNFFGSFVNENHFACYVSMVSLVTLGSIISSMYKWKKISWNMPFKYIVLNISENILNKKTLFKIFAFGVMAASVFLSKSRSGMIFFLASAAFFILFIALGKKRKGIIWIVLLGILTSYLLLNRIGADTVAARFISIFKSNDYEGRTTLYMQGLKLFRDYPLFGTGIGTFSNIFPMYQFGSELKFSEHLHNDILQFLIEAGAIGFIIIVIPFLAFIVKFISKINKTSDTYKYYAGLSILASLFYLTLHSLTDFGMRVNAISSLLIILIAVSSSLMSLGKERKIYIKGKNSKPVLYTASVIIFICSIILLSRPCIVSLLSEKGKTDLSFQLAMKIDPEDDRIYFNYCNFILEKLNRKEMKEEAAYKTATEAIDKAIQLNPYKSNYVATKGQICFWRYDYENAFTLLQKATLMEPDNPRANLIYSYMLFWKGINETSVSEREKLLAKGLAYYRRAGELSKHVHLYKIMDDKISYQILKSALKSEGIVIE